MSDMTAVIVPRSDQINADDMIAGPMTVTITGVTVTSDAEQPVSISLAGLSRVYRPCKSMSKILVKAWGADSKAYKGRSMTLYRDPTVKWAGMEVGGIRISHMSHLDRPLTMMLTQTKKNRAPHRVDVLEAPTQAPTQPDAPAPLTADQATASAKTAANRGTAAFRAWYNTPEGKAARATGALVMADLKALSDAADARNEDPFGLPPITPTPADIEAAIAADLAARDAELERGQPE